jgi:hypothetical protein
MPLFLSNRFIQIREAFDGLNLTLEKGKFWLP